MNATLTNGQARKSLSEQIDRLDSILDGLSDALQQAVAEAVQAAVKAVLTELLSKPELLARIAAVQGVSTVASRPKSELLTRTWNRVRRRSPDGWAPDVQVPDARRPDVRVRA